VTKRYPATDVTLSPSLAEILLELEDSYLIIILQARHRENSLLRAFFYLESDKRAAHRKPSGKNLSRSLFIPGLQPPPYMTIEFSQIWFLRPRFCRIVAVKIGYHFAGVFEVLSRLPTGIYVVVTSPLHQMP